MTEYEVVEAYLTRLKNGPAMSPEDTDAFRVLLSMARQMKTKAA